MPIKLNSSGGGSVTLDVGSTATNYTLTVPQNNSTLLTTTGGTIAGELTIANNATITGNVAFTSNNVTISGGTISPFTGMKNRIINGDFRIDQRFAGAGNNNINGTQYVVDRWYSYGTTAAKLRFQQNNTNGPSVSVTQAVTGFANYFGANVVSSNTVSAGDVWQMTHGIEGFNIADLGWGTANASPVTLSFWVYSSVPGTHGITIQNSLGNRAYPATYTINTANTWEQKAITIPGDTTGTWFANNSAGIYMIFDLGVGSTYYSSAVNNAWVAGVTGNKYPTGTVKVVSAANGSFYLTGVQMEKGSKATPFEFRHYGTELQLCQRYYQRIYTSARGYCQGSTYSVVTSVSWTPMRVAVSWSNFEAAASSSNLYSIPYSMGNGAGEYRTNSGFFGVTAAAAGDTYAYNVGWESVGTEL